MENTKFKKGGVLSTIAAQTRRLIGKVGIRYLGYNIGQIQYHIAYLTYNIDYLIYIYIYNEISIIGIK